MAENNVLIIVVIFAVTILAVIIAYRRRIKAGVKALGTELSLEAEGGSEPVPSELHNAANKPADGQPPSSAAWPAGRTVTASGVGSVAFGGGGKGATIVTGSDNTIGGKRRRR